MTKLETVQPGLYGGWGSDEPTSLSDLTAGNVQFNSASGAIRLTGSETNFLSAAVAGAVSGTPGTLTPTHKIAVNIEGVGVRYLHVGTTA